ncbi:MAG TPA: extracellular solute-binding protein [Candidatus Paceibacterota bacterium]|nr:extracellular solute-binding protein [Candidatus Paceibacterota bacterium]
MGKKSTFQYMLMAIFGLLLVIGVIVFAKSDPKSKDDDKPMALSGAQGEVVIWGTLPDNGYLAGFFAEFNTKYQDSFKVTYRSFDPKTFDRQIIEALASGRGPDVVLLPHDLIIRYVDKIIPIPYTPQFGEREFRNTFVQAADVYVLDGGMIAFPFSLDPLVMYWNRDLFANASLTSPPRFWEELPPMVPKLTKKDKNQNIVQSAVPFGEYVNVETAKDTIAMFLLQIGNPLVKRSGAMWNMTLMGDGTLPPNIQGDSVAAMRYFMNFSNPLKDTYTWNRSFESARTEFLNGNLAMYFDVASTYKILQQSNPHLNFDVAQVPLPCRRDDLQCSEITMARMHGLSVLKTSRNINTSFIAIQLLLDQENAKKFADGFDLPPVRRDLLAIRPPGAADAVFYDSAIRARTWLDPRTEDSDRIFKDMVDNITSGKNSVDDAMSGANVLLQAVINGYFFTN